MKLVAELLSTSVDTSDADLDTSTADTSAADTSDADTFFAPLVQDAYTQASAPKMRSVAVSVRVKGRDKGNAIRLICMMHTYINIILVATETEKSPECSCIGIQCDLLDAPPLHMLTTSAPQPSLDDSFLTQTTEQEDTDVDMDISFTCSQQDNSTEYVYIYKYI